MSRKKKHGPPDNKRGVRLVGWSADQVASCRPDAEPQSIATALATLAAATIGGSAAYAASGDLDPSFGNVGRQQAFDSSVTLWSVELQDDDKILFAGGDDVCSYFYSGPSCDLVDLTARLLPNGSPDAGFAAAVLDATIVYDAALQGDGKLVAVGTARQPDGAHKMVVFRLRSDGSLDPAFGTGGMVVLSDGTASSEGGYSVLVESDGHIVLAGVRGSGLVVARLDATGTLDTTFGTSGYAALTGSPFGGGYPTRVAAAPGGGYRVMLHKDSASGARCHVMALTQSGAVDASFGDDGSAPAPAPASVIDRVSCSALAIQPDGALVLGGTMDSAPYLGRALASGINDATFDPGNAIEALTDVTALAFGTAGRLYVAGQGSGLTGATVVRLMADGTLDSLFGSDGRTRFQVEQSRFLSPIVRDMKLSPDGSLVLAGAAPTYRSGSPFVARLLGDNAGGSPGVLSIDPDHVVATETSGEAIVHVERIGGSAGAVSVSYLTNDYGGATDGTDYTGVSGQLHWADGDTEPKEVVVPLLTDAVGETAELFEFAIESPRGGAGLGVTGTDVEIAGLHYPAGAVSFVDFPPLIGEGSLINLSVGREEYAGGAVSVTLRISGGTATVGTDVATTPSSDQWTDVVFSWADGDFNAKTVTVAALTDKQHEDTETVEFELINPSGGVHLGTQSKVTTSITDTTPRDSGGGSFGWLGVLLAGLAGLLRGIRPARSTNRMS
jgi:uncharacterized delta-60 repeat protein